MQVQQWAAEGSSVLRTAAGDTAFAEAFSAARESVAASARDRKQRAAVLRVLDPEAAAQVRLRRNAKKASEKKRKAAERSVLKEAGVIVKRKRSRTDGIAR
jgi:hypothetical protein